MNSTEENTGSNSSQANASTVCGAFFSAFNELGRAMAPAPNVDRHFREARKQFLMGIRELIDNRIRDLSRDETKGTRVVAE